MGRYLCQLCYTIVNYGEKHPCFFYKNYDIVYSLQDLDELCKRETKYDEAKDKNAANSNDNFGNMPEAQQNESNGQVSLVKNSKTKERLDFFTNNASSIEQGRYLPLLSNCSCNDRSLEIKTNNFWNLSEGYEPDYMPEVFDRKVSTRKSTAPVLCERTKGKEDRSFFFQEASCEDCETTFYKSNWHSIIPDEMPFSKSLEGATKIENFDSEIFSEASNSFPYFNSLKEADEDVVKVSGDVRKDVCRDNSITTDVSGSCDFVQGRNFKDNSEAQRHQSLFQVGSEVRDNLGIGFANFNFVNDTDLVSEPSGMNITAQWNTEFGRWKFVCRICGKGFLKKNEFVIHYRTHTGEKIFECCKCGKQFINNRDLTRLFRSPTGEKPFKCSACGKAFANIRDSNRHCKITHK